ncbi:MAG: glycosyltransferase family 4 protein, partial [Firmicutes bacterium]|nr:glycosyltransferase family 4 protein [Bacillota bacterium]
SLTVRSKLLEKGVEIILAAQPESALAEKCRERTVPCRAVRMRNEVDIIAVGELASLIKKEKIDLVAAQATRDHILAALAARLSGHKGVIKTEHNMLSNGISGFCRWIYDNLTSKIICVSNAVKTHMLSMNFPAEKLEVIYNGIDLDYFKTLNNEVSASRRQFPLVGVVSSLLPSKGQSFFLKSARLVLDKFPGVFFLVAGGGPELKNLEKLAEELNLGSSVIFTGYKEDIREVFESLDIFVFPTLEEAFGLVALEAMAYSKPVAGFRVGGVQEVVDDGQTGFMVDREDSEALAGAILKFLENPELAKKMGAEGRKRAETFFSVNTMADNYIELYRKNLAS